MDIQSTLYPFLNDLIVLMGTILLGFITAYVKQHYSAKQVDTAKTVANLAISFADEMAHVFGIDSTTKFNTAMIHAKSLAEKYGIKLSDEQWGMLIKAGVFEGRAIYNSAQGKVDTIPVVVEAPTDVIVPPEATTPPVELVKDVGGTNIPPAIKPVLDLALNAYNAVIADNIQVLSARTK